MLYNIKKVSELLGIPVVTIRAWENRYGIVSPTRTAGGHRLYSETDIETLKTLKDHINDKGIKISEAVNLLNQTKALIENNPVIELSYHHYDVLIDRLYAQLTDLDHERANETIDLAFSLFPFENVFHHILTPVLYRIGEQWQAGIVSVAQEHFASELFLSRFHQFMRVLPIQPQLPRAIALCPEGEHHQIGLMLFSLFLRNKGLDVIYLGANTPYSGLADIIEKKNISVVALSVTDPTLVEELESWVKSCRRQFPSITFVLGGSALHQSPERLTVDILPGKYNEWQRWFASTVR